MLTERMQHFVFPASAIAAIPPSPVIGLTQQVDLDAPFRLYGVVVWNLNVPGNEGFDGQLAIRFSRPDGRLIQRQLTSSNLLFPGNQYNLTGLSPNKALVATIRPGVLYPAGSVIEMDIMGLTTGIMNPTGVVIVFVGCNVYNEGAVWAPKYPQKWRAIPYLDNVTVTNIGAAAIRPTTIVRDQPFTAQADSDFVWQAGVYTDLGFTGGGCGGGGSDDICQLVDLGVIVRDPAYKAFSNGYVPAALLFPFLSAQSPGWLFPEIYIPRNSQIYFDLNYLYEGFTPAAAPITLTLGLKGMKVYAQ